MLRRPLGSRSLTGRAGRPLFAFVIVIAAARAMAGLFPYLLRDDRFVGDAAQHVWWMYRFADPLLFRDDPAARYYALSAFSPVGYQTLMRTAAEWVDLQHATELLAIGLALGAVALTALIGYRLGTKTGAVAALAVLIATHGERLAEGGFPRSFGLLLLLAGVLAILRHRWAVLAGVFVLAAVLYPPVLLNLAPVTAVVILNGLVRHGRLPRGFVVFAGLTGVAVALVAMTYLRPMPAEFGRWFTFDEIRVMPEWHRDGRLKFFVGGWAYYFGGPLSGIGLTMAQAAAAAVLLNVTVWACDDAITLEAWALLAGALGMWGLAHLTLLHLYLPSRYTTYALPVFGMLWAAGVSRELKAWLLHHRLPGGRRARVAVVGAAGAFAVGAIAFDAREAVALYESPANWVDRAGFAPVVAFLRTLPPNTIVAAHPDDANAIPLRAHRPVLVNSETSIAFHTAYYADRRRRLDAAFDLLYATDWPTIDALADRDRVSVFVVDTSRLTRPDERPYSEPCRTGNVARIAAGRAAGFAMLTPPPDRVLLRSGDYVVLRVGGGTH